MIDIQDITRIAQEELGRMAGGVHRDGGGVDTGYGGIEPDSENGLFLVDVKVSIGGDVEVFVDSDGVTADGRARGVCIEDCAALAKAIETHFDRDEEDFSLTVSSAGIGQPLKVLRQYRKLVGKQVEVVTVGGAKIVGVLEAVEAGAGGAIADGGAAKSGSDGEIEVGSITLSHPEKRKVEGNKKPEIATVTKVFPPAEVRTTKEHIDFK